MIGEFTAAIQMITILENEMEMFSSNELAKIIGVNPARVRRILAKLKKAKIVNSCSGVDGGYFLDDDIKDISLKTVYDVLDINIISKEYRVDKNQKLLKNIYNELNDEEKHLTAAKDITEHAENIREKLDEVYNSLNDNLISCLDKIKIGDIIAEK